MTDLIKRSRRARIRHAGAAVAMTAGLTAGLTPVVTAGPSKVPVPQVATVGLRSGAYGDDVRALQQALANAGSPEAGGVAGFFSSATDSALRKFQREHGLSATGVVSARTAAALGMPVRPAAGPDDILGPGSTAAISSMNASGVLTGNRGAF